MKWLVIGGAAVAAFMAVSLFSSPKWTRESHPDLASAIALLESGVLPAGLPASSRNIAISYNRDTGEAFLRFELPRSATFDFRAELIPVGRATAVALAMRHPQQLDDWDEVTLSARLRTGAVLPRRPRDGSRWYLIVREDGQVWGWNAPDIAPSPANGG
ncbi:MAG: hypothetical protein AAGD23_10295 [Pseudomonadota bacterium]